MGYVGAKISLEDVRKKMSRSRTAFKSGARTQKEKAFCNDNDAFNWCCRHYRYNYWVWHGNVENINRDTFSDYFYMIHDKDSYSELMSGLKEDYKVSPDTEVRYLIEGLRVLRKRYA